MRAKSSWTLCNPLDYSPPVSSVHGILQARILEWVAIPSSKVSSQSGDQTQVSYISLALAGRFFTTSTSWEASYTWLASPIISINHQNGVLFFFLTKDEPTLTHHNHPQSIGYLRVHRWCGTFHGLDKGTMMCIHHYCTMQNSFSALRILSLHPTAPPLETTNLFTVSTVLPFP